MRFYPVYEESVMALHSIQHTPTARRESHRLPRGVHRTRVSEMRFGRARATGAFQAVCEAVAGTQV